MTTNARGLAPVTAPLVAIVLLVAAAAWAQPAPGATRLPNIVLIVADDLGYGDLSSYGHATLKTPSLDRLADEGLRFTAFYAASPLCSPSRAAMMTGRTPFRTGIESWIPPNTDTQLGPREVTIATLLARRGYQTFLSGKWHLNGGLDVSRHAQPQDHGFQHWFALHAWAIPTHRNPNNFFRDGVPVGEIQGFAAQIVVDEAIGWLERRNPDAPFFLYVALAEPHGTIASPDRFNAQYAAFTNGVPDPMPNTGRPPDNIAARGPGEYYANVSHMDHQVGRLVERLDQLGLRDTTLVFFTSDNGPVTRDWRQWWEVNLYGSAGDRLRGRKGDLYEGGIRVPAIARWPRHVGAGRVTDEPAVGYDLLPTFAALAGVGLPADRAVDGQDLSPLLGARPFERGRPLYWEFDDYYGFHFALRDGRWKLIADRSLAKVRLFDLEADPYEVVDRAPEQPAITGRLLKALRERQADVSNDPLRPRTPAAP
jgi:arylsulfatase A-like enzyme